MTSTDGRRGQEITLPLAPLLDWAPSRLDQQLTLRLLARQAGTTTRTEVARQSGLGTAANLRLHFLRQAGTTPTAYRAAFTRQTATG